MTKQAVSDVISVVTRVLGPNTVVMGIDPGLKGAIAIIDPSGKIDLKKIKGDVPGAIAFIRKAKSEFPELAIVLEKVHSMPQNSGKSMFTFGHVRGDLHGAALMAEIPIICEPEPDDWKRGVGIACNPPKIVKVGKVATPEEKSTQAKKLTAYKKDQKTAARLRAQALYPQLQGLLEQVNDADLAEAVLMAHYGRLMIVGQLK